MDKREISFVEDKIKNYFLNKTKIKVLLERKNALNGQIIKLEEKIKNIDVDIKIDISSPSFEPNVQTSDKTSYFEKSLVNQIERLEKSIDNAENTIQEIESSILEIELYQISFEIIFNIFSDECKELLDMKYNKKYSVVQICDKLNISNSLYNKRKKKILESIFNFELIC